MNVPPPSTTPSTTPVRTRDVMTTGPVTCDASTSVVQVASLMRDHGISSVVVVNGDRVRGVVSDRDIVVRCIAAGANLGRALVTDALPLEMATISPDAPLSEARSLMQVHRLRCVAVIEEGRLIGVIDDAFG